MRFMNGRTGLYQGVEIYVLQVMSQKGSVMDFVHLVPTYCSHTLTTLNGFYSISLLTLSEVPLEGTISRTF
jgi:hypothetical protein